MEVSDEKMEVNDEKMEEGWNVIYRLMVTLQLLTSR